MELNLLILDDDKSVTDNYEADIDLFNKLNDNYKFKCFIANDLNDAFNLLNNENINYAIVDLRLTSHPDGETGNDLIKQILKSFTIPTTIVSGFTNDLSIDINDIEFINIIDRIDADTDEILNNFCNLERCGLTTIFSQNGKLQQVIHKLFWKHISKNLSNSNYTITEDSLIRYTANYIKDYFTYDSDGNDIDVKPYEFYIMPPISDKIQCGTIFNYDGNNYINLTPACDISNNKTNYYQIVKIVPYNTVKEIEELTKIKKSTKLEKALTTLTSNGGSFKYHFLPKHQNFEGGCINFQTVTSINKNELQECTIIGSVTSDFLKDITARFGMYFSRQGQPTLSDLLNIYNEFSNELNKE